MRQQDLAGHAFSSDSPHPRLRAGWLVLARLVVVAATAIATVFFVAGLGSYSQLVTEVCSSATCGSDQLPARAVSQLATMGLSLTVYAVYIIALQCVYVL